MPRTNKGNPWEVKFRKDVRSITKGLTASGNGKGAIKSTQLIWKRDVEPNSPDIKNTKPKNIDYACVKELPWQKKSAGRNLEIIKRSIEDIKKSPILNLKDVINKNAIEYDLKYLKSGSKAIIPHTYKGVTKDHTEIEGTDHEEFLESYQELAPSNQIKINFSNEEYRDLKKTTKDLGLKQIEVIKRLVVQYTKKFQQKKTEIFTLELDSEKAKKAKELFSKYAKEKLLKDQYLELEFLDEEKSKRKNMGYLPEEVWDFLRDKDEEHSKESVIDVLSSLFDNDAFKSMRESVAKDSEKFAQLLLLETYVAFEKSKNKFKKEFKSQLDLTKKIFKESLKDIEDDNLEILFACMRDIFKKEQIKKRGDKAPS